MDIKRKFRVLPHRRDDPGAERNVVHEMAIHYVEMNPIRASRFDSVRFLGECGKVSCKDGGSNQDFRFDHGLCDLKKSLELRTSNVERPTSNLEASHVSLDDLSVHF